MHRFELLASSPEEAIARIFGDASLRSSQEEALDAMCARADARGILATGMSKSIAYWAAAARQRFTARFLTFGTSPGSD